MDMYADFGTQIPFLGYCHLFDPLKHIFSSSIFNS
jgi:hypothetical protein